MESVICGPRVTKDDILKGSSELTDEIIALMPALRAFARSLTRNAVHGGDLVQETLVKALANVDKSQPGTRLRAWFFTIMRTRSTPPPAKASEGRPGAKTASRAS